jgi:hypothetical protein
MDHGGVVVGDLAADTRRRAPIGSMVRTDVQIGGVELEN